MGLIAGTAVAIGATAFAAADVVAVGLTVATAMEVVVAVGAVTSVIGMATGNKNMQMAGMALGIVGGVGALASSAGLIDGSASIFGDTGAGAAGNATGGIGETVDAPTPIQSEDLPAPGAATSGDALSATTATGDVNPNLANPVGAINSTSLAPATGDAAAIVTGGNAANPLTGALSASPISADSTTQLAGLTDAASPTELSAGQVQDLGNVTANSATDLSGAMPTFTTDNPGVLGQILAWGKSNPTLASGIVQAGGSFISGLTNPTTPAQINALNAQAAANNAAAAASNQKLANSLGNLPTASVSAQNVTGKPLIAPTPTNGLINNSVTGAAAPLTIGQ